MNGLPHSYTLCGLTIHSELELPELAPGGPDSDVVIRLASASDQAIRRPPSLCCNRLGRFVVRNQSEILVEPRPGTDEQELRWFLLNRIFGELLRLRGLLLLHASSVALGSGAIAFVGRTGAGKSTLAALFHTLGHGVLADDLIVVHADHGGEPTVHPGVAELQLLPDAAEFLGWSPEPAHLLERGKGIHRVTACDPSLSFPLRRVYVLADGAARHHRPLSPGEAAIELVRNSHGAHVVRGSEGILSHFHQCMTLASRVPVFRLERPRSLDELPDLAESIVKEVC